MGKIQEQNKIKKSIHYFFLFLPLLFISCGKSDEEKIDQAIESAHIYLTNRECSKAEEVLNDVGIQGRHARYLQTLASTYACYSDYKTTTFYGTNLSKISSSLTAFFGSLTKFTTSPMSDPDDTSYIKLLQSINVLLYAGGLSKSSSVNRAAIFSSEELNDIHIQLVYLIMTQIGKYLFYYGNANPTLGVKGTGTASNGNSNGLTNGCLYNYNPSDAATNVAITAIRTSGVIGSCTNIATGHAKLVALPNANTVKRMCQGIVLFNNLLDILSNTTIPNSGQSLKTLYSTFNTTCSSVSGISDLCQIKDQSVCEADYKSTPQTDKLEIYFFYIYETLFL
jgi:hypothetical protein